MIEFASLAGQTYAVQYSADLVVWKTAVPFLVATATRQQWLDDGAPKTESKPTETSKRFYRVVLLPAQ